MLALRLRWALRDVRARWIQVAGIALMLAIGTGLFAGLSSVTQWRIASNDASLEMTNMYDVRGRLGGDGLLPQGSLAAIAENVDGVEAAAERLIFQTQVEVVGPDGSIFVPGRVVGVDMSNGGPGVNGVVPVAGRGIEETEFGEPVALLERNFGVFYNLPEQGDIWLGGGGEPARYVGHAVSPEYFVVVEEGSFFGQANLAVVFTSLETAQKLSGSDGQVNDLVLTVDAGTDLDALETALLNEIMARHPDTHVNLSRREDNASYLALTRDPEGDQQVYNVLAVILFAGSAFAALNFAARMVEAQRREIGTLMALGVPPASIAMRPLLVGVQIAVLGVVFGIGVGLLISELMSGVLETFVALPVFLTPFQTGIFARVVGIGFVLPIVAVLWPVYRATRVRPVEAIRTGHLAARGGGLAPIISRLPLPGGSLGRMPIRNLVRAPRRTFLTLFALMTVLAILVSVVGLRDSFLYTLEEGDKELLGDEPDRLSVRLDSFYPADSSVVGGVAGSEALRAAERGLIISGTAHSQDDSSDAATGFVDFESAQEGLEFGLGDGALDLSVHFIDFGSDLWKPTAVEGALVVGEPGIVLAGKAASDLGVGVGDTVRLTHPLRTSAGSFAVQTSSIPVIAIHPHPLRFNAYVDIRHAGIAGLEGLANVVTAAPAEGRGLSDVKRAMFGAPGVATVQGLSESTKAVRDLFEQASTIYLIVEGFVLGLALLIAFNTANINSDERVREHATMFAFGVTARRVLGSLALEGLVLGVLAALMGVVLGYGLLLWMILALVPESYPDMGISLAVNFPQTAAVLAAGVLAVAVAPVFTVRKLRRMYVPGALRVLE